MKNESLPSNQPNYLSLSIIVILFTFLILFTILAFSYKKKNSVLKKENKQLNDDLQQKKEKQEIETMFSLLESPKNDKLIDNIPSEKTVTKNKNDIILECLKIEDNNSSKHDYSKIITKGGYDENLFLKIGNFWMNGEDLTLTNNEAYIILSYLISKPERLEKDRFKLDHINLTNDSSKTSFLFDSALGDVWILNDDKSTFNKTKIPNLQPESKNEDSEELIQMIIEKLQGIGINDTSRMKSSIKATTLPNTTS